MTKVTEEMIEYGVGVINHRMNNEGEDWAFDITGAISQILHGVQRMTAAQDSELKMHLGYALEVIRCIRATEDSYETEQELFGRIYRDCDEALEKLTAWGVAP